MKSKETNVRRKQGAPTDWDEVRRKLQSNQEILEQKYVLTAEGGKDVLRARAKVLAKKPAVEGPNSNGVEVVEFLLAHERYGIELAYVQEVHSLREFTQVPCTPAFVLGIMNVRGEVVSVLDLRKLFDLPERGLTDLNKVIILHDSNMSFGILADVVLGVRKISLNGLQTSLPTLKGIREKYLKGVTSESAVILDGEKLLKDEKIIISDTVEG